MKTNKNSIETVSNLGPNLGVILYIILQFNFKEEDDILEVSQNYKTIICRKCKFKNHKKIYIYVT